MAIRHITRFGIQRKIVANMTSESWKTIPHVCYTYEPDITKFQAAFKEYSEKHKDDEYRVTFNGVMLKTISEGLKAAPEMNAHIHFEKKLVRGKITTFDNIDISVPWPLPDGSMMTINMKDMGNKSLEEIGKLSADINRKLANTNLTEALYSVSIHDTIKALKRGHFIKAALRIIGAKTQKRHRVVTLKGKEKKAYDAIPATDKITREDLAQGTFLVSNVGNLARGLRGEASVLMIIPPMVCALAVCAIQRRPIVVTDENGEEKIDIRTILPLTICFDHRALDFAEVAPFIRKLEEIFENPEIILGE
ncbi:MAG: 2-oxo acid dehydrogenase subunit E2 [Ruminococcaceae bacterium]|nr:2-oxo acid dehydrogenase subunit E2 [Oscillospiraceae bacterium]